MREEGTCSTNAHPRVVLRDSEALRSHKSNLRCIDLKTMSETMTMSDRMLHMREGLGSSLGSDDAPLLG